MLKRMCLVIAVCLLLVFALTSCTQDKGEVVDEPQTWEEILEAAKKEGKVVFYSSGNPAAEEKAIKAFEEQTGIRVEYSRPGGGEVVIRQVQTERDANQYLVDVITLTDLSLGIYAREHGWLETISASLIPNTKNYLPPFAAAEYDIFQAYTLPMVIMYNTNLVGPDEVPQTYEDLADPKWKDQIVIGAPENAGATVVTIASLVELYGWDFIEKLKENNLTETRLSTEAAQQVAQGEKAIAIMPTIWALAMKFKDAPVDVHFPPNLISTDGITVVLSNSPNPNAAKVFLNFLLSEGWTSAYDMPQVGISFPFKGDFKADELLPEDPDYFRLDMERFYQDRQEILAKYRKIMG